METLDIIKSKIVDLQDLKRSLYLWNFFKKKIVFTNGCFDILHRGHIEYLSKAASFGDVLVVGLNTDSSIKNIKGPERPVQDEYSRSLLLAALQFVNRVILFDENTPYNLIRFIQPDVLVKGADYKEEEIVGYDIVRKKGGKVVTIELVKDISTSGLIRKLKK